MCKFILLPLIVATLSAVLTWAMAKYREMANEQRALAAMRPRGRPYATTMPDLLRR
jgi:hypothetical protein